MKKTIGNIGVTECVTLGKTVYEIRRIFDRIQLEGCFSVRNSKDHFREVERFLNDEIHHSIPLDIIQEFLDSTSKGYYPDLKGDAYAMVAFADCMVSMTTFGLARIEGDVADLMKEIKVNRGQVEAIREHSLVMKNVYSELTA